MKLRNTISVGFSLLIIACLAVPSFAVHADEHTTKKEEKEQKNEAVQTIETTQPGRSTSSPAVQEPAQPTERETPRATSTAATTSPVIAPVPEPENRTKIQERDPISEALEDVLNEVLIPETPVKKNTPVELKTTTTPPTKQPVITQPQASSTATSSATTTPIGSIQSTIDGLSNSFLPSNYYTPLDNLSPEMTYALSFVAMILGITGAVLIIRDPQTRQEEGWVPTAGFTQQQLLKP